MPTPSVTPLLAMVARYRRAGFSVQEIAKREMMAPGTVRSSIKRLEAKGLGVEAVRLACVIVPSRCRVCGCETFRPRCCGRHAIPVTKIQSQMWR